MAAAAGRQEVQVLARPQRRAEAGEEEPVRGRAGHRGRGEGHDGELGRREAARGCYEQAGQPADHDRQGVQALYRCGREPEVRMVLDV